MIERYQFKNVNGYFPHFQGPWAFLGGVANGSTSLVKHLSAGTLTSVTNFASSVSRNLDRLSLDQEHCDRNEVIRRERPKGLGQGLVNGLSGVGVSILGAVGGIAHHPISAIMEQGLSPTGLVSGVTRGLVGVVTKPLGGAAELVAQTGQGLLTGSGWVVNLNRKVKVVPDLVCDFGNSDLKYGVKIVGHHENVLAKVEVMSAVTCGMTLVLTEKALYVMTLDEDVQDSVHDLNEIDCVGCQEDPTKLTLINLKDQQEEVNNVRGHGHYFIENSVKERVAQFVMETANVRCTVSDFESEKSDENEVKVNAEKSKGQVEENEVKDKKVNFYASPVMVSSFLAMFHLAKRQIRHKGFDML